MSFIEYSMLRYIDNMILPCLNEIRQELPLDRIYQKTIAMLDIFAAHRKDSLFEKLSKSHVRIKLAVNYVWCPDRAIKA